MEVKELLFKYCNVIDLEISDILRILRVNIIAGVYCNKTDLPDIPTSGYRVRHLPEPRE